MSSKLDHLIETYHSLECEFNFDKSIEVCKEILNIDPTLIEYREFLGNSYYNNKEYEKSIETYRDYIDKGGKKDISNFMIALSYLKLNERKKAFSIVENIDDDEEYYLSKSRLHYELHEYDDAIEYAERTLEINDKNRFALSLLSSIYSDYGDDESSIDYFYELSDIEPQIKSILIHRLYSNKDYDEVIETFEEFKEDGLFDGDLENEHFNWIIGSSYYELGKSYDSLKYLLNSDRLHSDVEKKILIAKNYLNLLEFDNAHKYLLDALKIDPLNKKCLFLITETSYYRKEYLKAIEYSNELLKNYSCDKVFHVLAAVYFDLRNKEQAFECIKLGNDLMFHDYDLFEDYSEYILKIGENLSKAGFSRRAINIYNGLLEIHPDFYPIHLAKAKHYKRMGHDGLAKKEFKKYNDMNVEKDLEFYKNLE